MTKFKKRVISAAVSAAMACTTLASVGSAPATVTAAGNDYAKLLQYSLYFFDCNMCGRNSDCAVEWRGACHTGDDVIGGYHDAGDHAMFGLPQGFAASTIGWAYYEFPDAFKIAKQETHFKTVFKHFTEFFKASVKMNGDTVTSFLYQKGSGVTDHAYWGAPERQEQEQGKRRMYWTSNSASDMAGDYAAALAQDYLFYGDAESLKIAKALYKFSTQYNKIETDGPQEGSDTFYYAGVNASPADEQEWAAAWLYLATKDDYYKQEMESHKQQYLGWVHNWNTVAQGAEILRAEINGNWGSCMGWAESSMQEKMVNGYYHLDRWGSARLNCGMQLALLAAENRGHGNYYSWCEGQMDYLLGKNPFNTCFVTGYASNSAKNTHHRAASGWNGYEEKGTNNGYSSNGHVLIGALAGGPYTPENGGSLGYTDTINDYVGNEVAIDYNACLVGAAAGLLNKSKSGSPDTSIVGVKNVVLDSGSSIVTGTSESGSSSTSSSSTTSTTSASSTSGTSTGKDGEYEIKVNKNYSISELQALPENERMIAFPYEDFGLTASSTEKITKVEVNISSSNNLGTYVGAFGTSTKVEADGYWYMSDEITKSLSGNKGTITWEPSSSVADIIQYGYGGELKIGFWWIDSQSFTIDSVKIYTTGGSSSSSTTKSTTSSTTTSSTTSTTSSTTTSSTTSSTTTSTTTSSTQPRQGMRGDADANGLFELSDAVLIARAIAGMENLSTQGKLNADVDGKEGLSDADLTMVLKALAGILKL